MKTIEIFFRKILLKLLLLFYGGGKRRSSKTSGDSMNCFVVRLNRIGDALVTTPLLKLLKEKLNCRLILLADKRNRFVFENNPYVDELLVFQKGLKGFKAVRKYFNDNRIDVLIDSHDDISTTVSFIVAFSGVSQRFALAKGNESIYTDAIERKDASKFHIAERVAELAKLCGADFHSDEIKLVYNPKKESLEVVDFFLRENRQSGKPVVGINISAGSDARFWGIEKYKTIIEHISSTFDVNLILLRAPDDKEKAAQIANENVNIFNDKSFDQFAAMISKLDILISPDTSAVHLAAAFGVPVFGLYVHYKTDDVIWYPFNVKYEAVITRDPNLSSISTEEVIEKLDPFLFDILMSEENG